MDIKYTFLIGNNSLSIIHSMQYIMLYVIYDGIYYIIFCYSMVYKNKK